jgi:hypothetical protein
MSISDGIEYISNDVDAHCICRDIEKLNPLKMEKSNSHQVLWSNYLKNLSSNGSFKK